MEMSKTEWEETLGSNQWEGLLEPLDLNLSEPDNPVRRFFSRFGKNGFFKKVANKLAENDYFVDSFLYATSKINLPKAFLCFSFSNEAWSTESNWIGYIAVSTDEASERLGRREIYVAWRGTIRTLEWMNFIEAVQTSVKPLLKPETEATKVEEEHHWYDFFTGKNDNDDDEDDDEDDDKPKVMKGWLAVYNSANPDSQFTKLSARTQILTKIRALVTKYEDENVSVVLTGHSLGAILAILSAFDLVENGLTQIPVTAIVFGSPQIGNNAFKERLESFSNLRILHVKNEIDLITHYPSKLLGYAYTEVELEIDTRKSKSLKDSKNPSDWHNLQAILHIVAGWNGKDGEFDLKRSVALVNKSCDYLKDETLVPGSWWVERNKRMVLNEDGEWIMAIPDEEDLPVLEEY
ncbi:hypothetical protein MKX01_042153 [Papaver californicum]|nr:hypothetical protein MKX01_042153 [Papaver californicum]